jgi:hypothetical protein
LAKATAHRKTWEDPVTSVTLELTPQEAINLRYLLSVPMNADFYDLRQPFWNALAYAGVPRMIDDKTGWGQ